MKFEAITTLVDILGINSLSSSGISPGKDVGHKDDKMATGLVM